MVAASLLVFRSTLGEGGGGLALVGGSAETALLSVEPGCKMLGS